MRKWFVVTQEKSYELPQELDIPVGMQMLIVSKRNYFNMKYPSSSISVVQYTICEDLIEKFNEVSKQVSHVILFCAVVTEYQLYYIGVWHNVMTFFVRKTPRVWAKIRLAPVEARWNPSALILPMFHLHPVLTWLTRTMTFRWPLFQGNEIHKIARVTRQSIKPHVQDCWKLSRKRRNEYHQICSLEWFSLVVCVHVLLSTNKL